MSTARKQSFSTNDLELSQKLYEKFAKKMYDLAGVNLPYTDKNVALVRNRIIKLLRVHNVDSFEDYWRILEKGDDAIVSDFISALTTNLTSFYREPSHFDFLSEHLPQMLKKAGPELRIWCAAASTGQEPYTIAITAINALADQSKKVRILATDIDLQVLKKASIGTYEEKEMQGLAPAMRLKYFEKIEHNNVDYHRATDAVHNMIRFAPFNLMNHRYEFRQKFHVVFCRNVLIYFDEATTKRVLENLVSVLEPGGYLILGHSESGNVKHKDLRSLSRAVYQKLDLKMLENV